MTTLYSSEFNEVRFTAEPTAYYKFNGNAKDYSENNNTGALTNATLTTDRFGNANSAYEFSGSSSEMLLTNTTPYTFGTGDFTISLWAKPTVIGTYNTLYEIGVYTNGILFRPTGTSIQLYISYSVASDLLTVSHTRVVGRWDHYLITRNSGVVKIFVNGIQLGSATLSKNITMTTTTDSKFGSSTHTGTQRWNGAIDDIIVFNTGFTDSEVQKLYQDTIIKINKDKSIYANEINEVGFNVEPVGYWKLNNDTLDYSGNKYDGVGSNIVATTNRFGTANSAYTFNGSSSVIKISEITAFNLQNFAISAWVKFADDSSSFIFEKGNVNTQYSLFASSTTLYFRTKPVGASYDTLSGTKATCGITNGTWHHIVATYDGAQKKVYVDGVEKLTKNWTSTIEVNNNDCSIGRFGGTTTGYYFTGDLDEIAIFPQGLTPSQIKTLYEDTRIKFMKTGIIHTKEMIEV